MSETNRSPIVTLILQRMEERHLDRESLCKALSKDRSPIRVARKLDLLFGESRFSDHTLQRVAGVLGISPEEIGVLREDHLDYLHPWRVRSRRAHLESYLKRRGPHLWGILPYRCFPNLISIVGPEFFFLQPVPQDIVKLPHTRQMKEVGKLAKRHYEEHRRCRLLGYDYRRSIDEVFRFGPDGEALGRVDNPVANAPVSIKVGNRRMEGPLLPFPPRDGERGE